VRLAKLLILLRGDRTLRDMEKVTGISNAFWSQLERGKVKSPSIDTIKRLCAVFPHQKQNILEAVGL